MEKVKIYSTPKCHFCEEGKQFLDENNIGYISYDVSKDLEKRKEMVALSGAMGVPVFVFGDKFVIGFDKEKLKELLSIK